MRMSVKVVALCSAMAVFGVACTSGGGSSNSTSPQVGRPPDPGHHLEHRHAEPVRDVPAELVRGVRVHLPAARAIRLTDLRVQAGLRAVVGHVCRRPHVDVPYPAEREMVRRPAADRERCGVDDEYHPEVRRRPGRQPDRVPRLREDGEGNRRQHTRRHVLHRGRERPPRAPGHSRSFRSTSGSSTRRATGRACARSPTCRPAVSLS